MPTLTDDISAVDHDGDFISALPPDIIRAHILTRLDGPTLASVATVSAHLRFLSCQPSLWAQSCRDTWPSTDDPRVEEVVSSMPGGHRAFFTDSFPLPAKHHDHHDLDHRDRVAFPSELISAVDLRYRGEMILSKAVATETSSGWFDHSPFRVDLLHRKDVVPTAVEFFPGDHNRDTCRELEAGLELSWIVIDPAAKRAANLSSLRPVAVHRHVISGDVHVRFASVVPSGGKGKSSSELAQCGIMVTCGGSQKGLMHVREVCLVVEDLDGTHLNGRDSLVILRKALGGKRGKGVGREMEGKKRYQEFLERKTERKEKKIKDEKDLDKFSVIFLIIIGGVLAFIFL